MVVPFLILALPVFARPPPLGAVYGGKLTVAIVGTQCIDLTVLTKKKALIRLSGMVNHDETVHYNVDASHRVSFEMTEMLEGILRRYTCSISEATYDPHKDSAKITFTIRALRMRRKVMLHRKNPWCSEDLWI